MLDTKIGQTPPPIIIDHLSMVYSGQESRIEINPEYFDKAQEAFEEMRARHEQFEEIIKKIDLIKKIDISYGQNILVEFYCLAENLDDICNQITNILNSKLDFNISKDIFYV